MCGCICDFHNPNIENVFLSSALSNYIQILFEFLSHKWRDVNAIKHMDT